jgi:aminopeptidase N
MLRGFDAAGRNATTQPERLQESYRREREGYRMRLLLFALEDAGGRDALHRATRRMLQALRGGTWGRNELRSALEAETGKDLGEFFRVWARPDEIPAAFRAAYPQ